MQPRRSASARSFGARGGPSTKNAAPSALTERPAIALGTNATSGDSPVFRTRLASTPPRSRSASRLSAAKRPALVPRRSPAHSDHTARAPSAPLASCAPPSAPPRPSSSAKLAKSRTAPAQSASQRRRRLAEPRSAPASAASRRRYSPTWETPSFDSPRSRSTNSIGTSIARRLEPPRASSSSRILKPAGAWSSETTSARRAAKNPDIGSLTGEIGQASAAAARDASLRRSGQPRVEPPRTWRLPIAIDAAPSRSGRTRAGIAATGCERSASMTTTTSARAARAPAITARERPRSSRRTITLTGCRPDHARARSAVPSRESSSTTITSNGGSASERAKICRSSSSTFSASSSVGTTIENDGFVPGSTDSIAAAGATRRLPFGSLVSKLTGAPPVPGRGFRVASNRLPPSNPPGATARRRRPTPLPAGCSRG